MKLACRLAVAFVMGIAVGGAWVCAADEPATNQAAASLLPFEVQTDVILQDLNAAYCWFHPRAAAIPGAGIGGAAAIVVTLQKHLVADDHYSGLFTMHSNDLGKTWTGPLEIPALGWQQESDDVTIAVADVTSGWHAATGNLLAIGTKVRYSRAGAQLGEVPRSNECAYAVYNPQTDQWSSWQMLAMPETDGKFYLVCPGCVQWLVEPDGTLLVPVYFRGPTGSDYSATVLHCKFDGQELSYIAHGDELALDGGRGLVEPSLAYYRGTYYLTLRNDARGYVAASSDGLHFDKPRPWTFDDGSELGSYNTQQHWLVHSDGLFLTYTRRGANNDHIARHRAPLFIAQVDENKRHVVRSTERVLMPERGVMLGNFGATAISPDESWATDSEFITGGKGDERGADGSTFVARVRWSRPNMLAAPSRGEQVIVTLGDSITKGVRAGVAADETFAARLERSLRAEGRNVRVVNVGIGGERTDQALARLASDVISLQPSVVTIMYGTNDSYVDQGRTEPRLTAHQYRDNLLKLATELRSAGITPLLMTEPRWGNAAALNGAGEHPNLRLEAYMAACHEVASSRRLPLVDHYRLWSDANSSGTDIGDWTTDQCHPNPEGHRRMAEAMLPAVRQALGVALMPGQ